MKNKHDKAQESWEILKSALYLEDHPQEIRDAVDYIDWLFDEQEAKELAE